MNPVSVRRNNALKIRRLGIDTYQEPVIYMRADCPVCRAEGFEAQSRIEIWHHDHSIIATLNVVKDGLIAIDEAGLSESAWRLLHAHEGATVTVSHPPPLESLSHVRAKVYGKTLGEAAMHEIVRDIAAGRYSDIHLSSFITACAGDRFNLDETVALTRAMIDVGDRITWERTLVVDKHGVGGLPGNRTTLIVVPIVAAFGLTIPKTSSRSITSPAGTADTMETLAPVALDIAAMRRVVEREGGCIVWGGAVHLSPADEIMIRVEKPLDLDSEGQLVASVLSKKAAAGATDVVIDVPVGPTAKVRSAGAARSLNERLGAVGAAIGLNVRVMLTDGSQPVGGRIGPALEARDVLAVLGGESHAPADLRERALFLAGTVLELSPDVAPGTGRMLAQTILDDGRAWRKFQAICDAQGGMREPPQATHTRVVTAGESGTVLAVDNRKLARIAKLTGAPLAPAAGIELHVKIGNQVAPGQPVFTIHAETPGELAYAAAYAESQLDIVSLRAS